MSPAVEWSELARTICKRNEENKLNNQQVLDMIDESEEDYDEEETPEQSNENDENSEVLPVQPKEETTKKPVPVTKAPKVKSTAKPKSTTAAPPSVVDSDNENDESEADENYDYSEEDDDDEDREDETISRVEDPVMKKNNILLDGIKVIKEIDNRIFGKLIESSSELLIGIFYSSGGSNDNDGDSQEVTIEEASTSYRFIWPMLIVMLSIVVVLLVIMNVIALCMRKRGERYRQALLQSKNSIIYQKLSEEIAPQTPKIHRYVITAEKATPQTPKAHRYTPIQQV